LHNISFLPAFGWGQRSDLIGVKWGAGTHFGEKMDDLTRLRLQKHAADQLERSRHDEEQWSFLFRTPGAIDLLYCPWTVVADWEFDGDLSLIADQLSNDRRQRIEKGVELLNEAELVLLRKRKCEEYANGSDWSQVAWIVPLSEGAEVIAWALVLCPIDGDIDPFVSDVYESIAAAIKALELEGALNQS
jgi:hypothetical protein